MTAPTAAVDWLLARAAVRATGRLHLVSRRDSDALNPLCGANPIRSREIETHTTIPADVPLCPDCTDLVGRLRTTVTALLDPATAATTVRLVEAPIGSVHARRDHPRRSPGADIDGLVHSVAEHGIVQPLVARRSPAGYELIAGARRLYAAHAAGLTTVPVLVRDATDEEATIAALVENLHRADLNPIEQAHAYVRALAVLQLSKEALAGRLGISRPQVSNTIRLLDLPTHLQERLAAGEITAAEARDLLRETDPETRDALAARLAAERAARTGSPRRSADPQLAEVAQLLTGLLDTHVRMTSTSIVIRVSDETDRARILARLGAQAAA